MKFKILLFLHLISFPAIAQSIIFTIDNGLESNSIIPFNNDKNKKFKIKFASYEGGKYFVVNQLLYGNKTAKTIAYFKEFDVYVVREAFDLKYLTFKEAFPKGGFYKDSTLKTIYEQKAESYTLDNDVLDMKIWIANGVQVENKFIEYLNNLGLLRNIPKNKNIVALSIQGLELDLSDLKIYDAVFDRGSLSDFLVSFKEQKDNIEQCSDSLQNKENLIDTHFETKTIIDFPYKITINNVYKEYAVKETKNFTSTLYSSADGTLQLFVFPVPDINGVNAQFYDFNLMKVFECMLVDNNLSIYNSSDLYTNQCKVKQPRFISNSENTNFYFSGKQTGFYLIKYELDEKNYPTFTNKYDVNQVNFHSTLTNRITYNKGSQLEFLLTKYGSFKEVPIFANWNFKNGFIKGYTTLDKEMNQETVTRTLEKGTFNFNFSK